MYYLLVLAIFQFSSLVGAGSDHDCTNDSNRIIERSCNEIVQCKSGKLVTTTCELGEVIDFRDLKCHQIEKVPLPCGRVVDCSKRPDGKYAKISQGCRVYYTCLARNFVGNNVCPKGLVFNEHLQACDWPFNVSKPCGTKAK